MPDDRELDSILDIGLARYSEAEPLAGLEERILQRIRSTPPKRKSAVTIAAFCCVAAAIVAFAVLLPLSVERPSTFDVKPKLSDMRRQTTKSDGLPHMPLKKVARSVQRRARRPILPKQPDFPARTPLSREERVLLRTASSSMELAKSEEPITIEPIEVSPITINDSGAENEPSNP